MSVINFFKGPLAAYYSHQYSLLLNGQDRVFTEQDVCPHGPYLYHVTQERHSDGTETPYWRFIGEVRPDDE